ncbi:unnamed protein product [Camellia sinensis]
MLHGLKMKKRRWLQYVANEYVANESLDKLLFSFEGNSLMRILNIAAFAVSGYSCTEGRNCKPFNPLLGETYEAAYPDNGLRFISEKTRQAFTPEQINEACYVDINSNKAVFDSLRNNPKVNYDGMCFPYKSKHALKDKNQLLILIRKFPEGIVVIDLKDAYPTVMEDLQLTLVEGHAAVSPGAYWNMVLPNAPMPRTVKNLLSSGRQCCCWPRIHAMQLIPPWDLYYDSSYTGNGYEQPVYYGSTFFLEEDIKQGTKMKLNLSTITQTNGVTFLPRQVAQMIPFSSNKFLEILNRFLIKPNSVEAEIIKETIKVCERSSFQGERKYCATSLESMIDFCTSMFGKNIQAFSTELEKLQEYRISGLKMIGRGGRDDPAVCHMQNYLYAVFYCHNIHSTETYMLSLEGADGTKAKVAVVCRKNTSAWNPKHLAFQILKVKPGTVPICRARQDNIVWLPN